MRQMTVTIRRAHDPAGPAGWDLFIDGKWHERYRTRREALAAAANLRQQEKRP